MKNFAKRIDRFVGPWAFLSNFYAVWIVFEGLSYPSVEHAYQAAKTLDIELRKKLTDPDVTPGQAKRWGERLKKRGLLREDWFDVNIGIMRELLIQKFSKSILRRKLLATFGAELIEGNNWHDEFWGICDGACNNGPHEPNGLNWLGKLLMEVRSLCVGGMNVPDAGNATDGS